MAPGGKSQGWGLPFSTASLSTKLPDTVLLKGSPWPEGLPPSYTELGTSTGPQGDCSQEVCARPRPSAAAPSAERPWLT